MKTRALDMSRLCNTSPKSKRNQFRLPWLSKSFKRNCLKLKE